MLNKKVTALTLAVICAASLASCSGGDAPETTTAEDTTLAEDVGTPDNSLDAEEYYQSVIAALEEQLLLQKQENYISEYEYDLKIRELQAQIDALKAGADVTDKPTVESDAPTENLGSQETLGTAQNTPTYEGEKMSFRYGIENGTVTIYEYLGGTTTVAIPSTINGYRVVAIADYAFANSSVTAVVIPPSVKSIGWFAFNGCASLSSISIPASVTSIGYAAFDGCDKVTILCVANSYAKEYAASFGMSYQVI